jgi:zinc-binding alcohol dehydrogenase/oxidoreductase
VRERLPCRGPVEGRTQRIRRKRILVRAVRIHELGGPSKLVVDDVPDPVPAAGEICVRIRRAAFNRRDVFITQGLYPGIAFPSILGSDGCGVVAAHGSGASGPAVGAAVVINPMLAWGDDPRVWQSAGNVLGMPHPGTFADFICVPAENVFPKPARLDIDRAAALPLAGLTAYRAVFTRGGCTRDDVVLIPGIGGGVQTFVLQFVKSTGAKAIVTSSSEEKLARATALGADVAINYRTNENWSREVRAQSGGGPTLIVDSVGGDTFARALDIARPGARAIVYGGTTGDAKIRPFSVFWKHLDILGTSMGTPADFQAMLALVERTGLQPAVDAVFPLADVVAAAERLAASEQFGKIVLALD